MTKKKHLDEDAAAIDKLERQVRELKALNRALMKRLKKLDRQYREADEDVQEVIEEELIKKTSFTPVLKRCPKCNKEDLQSVRVAGRSWESCNGCKYRTKAIKD